MSIDFFVILSYHGKQLPESLKSKIDAIYWEPKFDAIQCGRGHPKYCLKAFELAKAHSCEKTVKVRGYDIISNELLLKDMLTEEKIVITEQTSFVRKELGDLLMIGNNEELLQLWSVLPWNYKHSGLTNLYRNASHLATLKQEKAEEYIKSKFLYLQPQKIMWYTLENNWDKVNKKPRGKFNHTFLWGYKKYPYYGGF